MTRPDADEPVVILVAATNPPDVLDPDLEAEEAEAKTKATIAQKDVIPLRVLGPAQNPIPKLRSG